jgi:hypothetical protein
MPVSETVVLPGEDRSYGGPLCVDLIPSTSWFRNVRSAITSTSWRALRNRVYDRADNRCELCGSGDRLDTHERFSYDFQTGVQRLERLVAVCGLCHLVSHFGFAAIQGNDDMAVDHLARIRGWDDSQVERHIDDAFRSWEQRSLIRWILDLAIVSDAGYAVKSSRIS